MLQLQTQAHQTAGKKLSVSFARTMSEVLEAQRLRYKVFGEKMGARLASREEGIDRDMFDPFCEHVLARDNDTGEVVGTYRILNAAQAKKLGGFYSDDEFDLARITHLRNRLVEVGRSCVHPDYRSGAAIALLWSGVAQYLKMHRYEYVIGCASISMADGGIAAASIFNKVKSSSMSPAEYRVFPRCPLPLARLDNTLDIPAPPLIKGYLRLGAYVCGAPAWDPDFNTADLFMLLPMSNIDHRYAKRFIR